jgi:glycosyltransferase involved in cell wall biosynthesis
MHIVVFPGWYPNRNDELSGDFIQRHMHAIAQFCDVSVVIPIKDEKIKNQEKIKVEKGRLTEIYYYYPSFSSLKWLDSFLSFIRYNYLCIKEMKALHAVQKIDLVHVYVLQKNHLVGRLLNRLYKIPYVISEQSTLYIDGQFDTLKAMQKKLFQAAFQSSASFHAVSKYLLKNIQSKLKLNKDGVVIPNVVDASHFYCNHHFASNAVTFVHVSNMVYQKNVEGMLQAFAEVKKVNGNFVLNLVGPLPGTIRSLISELQLEKEVVIWNQRSYKEVAEIMQQSDVFVFFSRYETFGCVIVEANACGLPLIVTDLEVTRELVNESFNGVFVVNEDVKSLADKILFMISNLHSFDPLAISLQCRNRFNYERVGQQFLHWYNSVLSRKN